MFIVTKREYDRVNQRNVELARIVKQLEEDNKELRAIRKQDVHNNSIIVEKNRELLKIITEVADRAVQCPLDSEKIVMAKIRELTHDYQSKS